MNMALLTCIPEPLQHKYRGVFRDYWSNNFKDLRCKDLSSNEDDGTFGDIQTYEYEMKLLSHVCLNGSFSHLSYEEWNNLCFPSYGDKIVNLGWRRAAGVWSLFNFLVGLLGNMLTMVAVAYARAKQR